MATPQRGTIPSVSQDTSRPYFTQRVKLNSLHAQQVFNRGYDLCANAIFSLSIVLRVIGSDEQAHEIEGVVDERINKQFEDLHAESARLDKVAEANGIEFSGIDYSSPKDVEARITSPRAVRYIGLIREFDALVAKFDTLWLSGVIPDGNYSRSVYEWKRRLLRLAGSIRAIASQAMIVARKKEQLATASAVENTNTSELAVVDALNELVDSGPSMEPAPAVA